MQVCMVRNTAQTVEIPVTVCQSSNIRASGTTERSHRSIINTAKQAVGAPLSALSGEVKLGSQKSEANKATEDFIVLAVAL